VNIRGLKDIEWHGCKLYAPGWDNPSCRVLGFTMGSFEENESDIHVMLNMEYGRDLDFEIPDIKGRDWYRFVDTSLPVPEDIIEDGNEKFITGNTYNVKSYSAVILISK